MLLVQARTAHGAAGIVLKDTPSRDPGFVAAHLGVVGGGSQDGRRYNIANNSRMLGIRGNNGQMNFPVGIISTDFDGTLHSEFEDPPVPASAERMLGHLQTRGAAWVINTGRDLPSLMEALDQAGVSVRPDWVVAVEREIYFREDSQYVGLEGWNRRCGLAHEELFLRVRPDVPQLAAWINSRYEARVYADAYSPFCLIAPSDAEAGEISHYLNSYCVRVPSLTLVRNGVYARFGHLEFNKGSALAEISGRLGVHRDRVVAAGDHLNDVPMLTKVHAKWLIAPSNAVEEVKELVRGQDGYVSGEPNGHGLARGLEHVLERCRGNARI